MLIFLGTITFSIIISIISSVLTVENKLDNNAVLLLFESVR